GGAHAHAVLLGPAGAQRLVPGTVVVVDQSSRAGPGTDGTAYHDGAIGRLDRDVAALTATGLDPVGLGDDATGRLARQADRPVVLLRPVDPVRLLLGGGDVGELRGRLVVDRPPRHPAVERHARHALVAFDHPPRVGGIDPEIVVVAVRRGDLEERLAAVEGLPRRVVEDPERVDVGRIGKDVHVVPGPTAQARLLAVPLPGGAAIVRAEECPVLGFYDRVDTLAIDRRHRDADATEHTTRQTGVACDVAPRVAAVCRAP